MCIFRFYLPEDTLFPLQKFIRKILTVYFDHRKKHTNVENGKRRSSLLMLKQAVQIASNVIQRIKC